MNPGIYPGMPMGAYLAIPAVNASALKLARRSMLHVKAALDGREREPSDEMAFGTLVHAMVLEPDTVQGRYTVDPGPAAFLTKAGKVSDNYRSTAAYEAWAAGQAGEIVSGDDLERAKACAAAVAADALAVEMLAGQHEVVIVWEDPATGVLCKGRVDALGERYLGDLKTTRDAGYAFEKQIASLDYVLSMAFYRRGHTVLTGEYRMCGLVAVESDVPVGVRAAPIGEHDLIGADLRIDEYLARVRNCQLSDVWPGYDNPPVWPVPAWLNDIDLEDGGNGGGW